MLEETTHPTLIARGCMYQSAHMCGTHRADGLSLGAKSSILLPNLNSQFPCSIRRNPNLPQLSNHGVSVCQNVCRIRTCNSQHFHPTRARRLNPRRRVFNDQTFDCTISQPLRPLQIRLRMGLPVGHIIGSDQNFRHRQSTMPQAILRQQPGTRSDHSPPSLRN